MSRLTRTFAALSDDTRLAVMEQLMAQGELPAGAISAQAQISAPAVSRHLKILRQAGLIRQRVDGSKRLYSVCPDALQNISDWTLQHQAYWQAGLDRLHGYLTQQPEDPNG